MVFSGIPFLFRFLPVFMTVYFLAPRKKRNLVLFLGSLLFYAWGEPVYILLMLFSTVSDYFHGRLIGRLQRNGAKEKAKAALISSLLINILLLGFFKYADFIIGNINASTGADIPLLFLPLPLGISFYTFQTMSYTIDVYRGETEPQKDFIAFGAYVSMFPQLIAGPIVKYKQVAAALQSRRENAEQISQGIRRFVAGLGKKVLLANQAGILWEQISAIPQDTLPAAGAWLGILAFAFQIYFDFSGYSDMAIGLGAILGFTFPENFHYPYTASSITQFWRRWHMTLGGWFREYVYIPLGGSRRGLSRQLGNILLVWMFTGIWHGAGWNFLLWGLWFALFLMLEKLWMRREHKIAGRIYTIFVVLIGWVFFSQESLPAVTGYLQALFGLSMAAGPAKASASETVLFLLCDHRALLLCLIIGATPLPKQAAERFRLFMQGKETGKTAGKRAERVWNALELLFLMALFLLSVAFLVDASYNPFLYFRF